MPSMANLGGKFYTKLGDVIAAKCAEGKAEKARPLVATFLTLNGQLCDHAMDGDYTEVERAADAEKAAELIKMIGEL